MFANASLAQVLILIAVLVVAAVVLGLLVRARRRTPLVSRTSPVGHNGGPPRAAVVVHGMKVDDQDARRRQIDVASGALGWAEPVWLETTAEDPGVSQTKEALAQDVDTVLAFGGDGTARVVAGVLAGTQVPMGLLPAGTGNLLARNLGIPPNRLESSLHIALTGRPRTIDVGRAKISRSLTEAGDAGPVASPGASAAASPAASPAASAGASPGAAENAVSPAASLAAEPAETFLVMAGLGFDAEVMAGADSALKDRLGWGAYVVTGLRSLRGRRTPVTITVDDDPPQHRKVRSVVVGNCGTLQGGIQLMPGALLDDGWLDVVIVAPRSLAGWLSVTGAVLTRRRHSTVQHLRCRRIEIRAEKPLAAQLDGDPAGVAQVLRASVDPLALVVRVPG